MIVNDRQVDDSPVRERYLSIKERVWHAAQNSGREPAAVTLVAVTKTFAADDIVALLEEGHRIYGENRVQEAAGKWPALRERFDGIELHLIGPLQSNKAADAVRLFDCIQTLDRLKLAAALATEIRKQGRQPKLLVQVNTGLEPQKAGILPNGTETFVKQCQHDHGLEIAGLMCIPPAAGDPSPHFATLRALRDRIGLSDLSMGMSGDFEIGIAHGATIVRVGSAIFGYR